MRQRTKIIVAAGGMALAAAAGTGIAVAGGAVDDDDAETEVPITGTDLDRASAAALAFTGEGRVTDTEAGDEESYYEVEVTLEDGSQVDVQLDERFNVVASEADHEEDGD